MNNTPALKRAYAKYKIVDFLNTQMSLYIYVLCEILNAPL